MAGSPCITLGSHSMTHARLPLETEAVIAAELEGSRDVITEWTGRKPDTLAYPNGDHDDRVVAARAPPDTASRSPRKPGTTFPAATRCASAGSTCTNRP